MRKLFDSVSNYGTTTTFGYRTGKTITSNGKTVILESKTYECHTNGRDCAYSDQMLSSQNRYGSIECSDDLTGCILDGKSTRRVLIVYGTSSSKLTLRSLTFQNGQASTGGGLYLRDNAIVDILLCVFSGCSASSGGGIFQTSGTSGTTKVYGTVFTSNSVTNRGADIYQSSGTVTIYSTCPSPYSANIPTKGETLIRI
jgi:hypothetical protein